MELDQLKLIWKDVDKPGSQLNKAGLDYMLTHRSKLPIAIMKRNLRLEVFFLIVTYGFIIWLILNEFDRDILYFEIVLLVVTAVLFFVYAYHKYKLLNNMECMSCEVKSNLNQQLQSLEKLVKLYFNASNLSVILVYFIAGAISYMESQSETISFPHYLEILIFIAIGSLLAIVNYSIGRWYLFNLYEKHIQKLKNILYEMDEFDTR